MQNVPIDTYIFNLMVNTYIYIYICIMENDAMGNDEIIRTTASDAELSYIDL